MNRQHSSWSNFTDVVEGPCVVCNQEVHFVIPADREDPTILYHATCDPIGVIRVNLKTKTVPPMNPSETIRYKNGVPPPAPVAAAPAPTPAPAPAAPEKPATPAS